MSERKTLCKSLEVKPPLRNQVGSQKTRKDYPESTRNFSVGRGLGIMKELSERKGVTEVFPCVLKTSRSRGVPSGGH